MRSASLCVVFLIAFVATAQDTPRRALIPSKPIGPGGVSQVTLSPDGRLLALETTIGFQIRDAKSGRILNSFVADAPPPNRSAQFGDPWRSELVWSWDSRQLARANGGIEIWDPMGSAPKRILGANAVDKEFHELAWSPDGARIAAHSAAGVVVWDLRSGKRTAIPVQAPNEGIPQISGFAWSPVGDLLAVASGHFWQTEVIDIWNLTDLTRSRRIPVEPPTTEPGRLVPANSVIEIPVYSSRLEWSWDGGALALSSGFNGMSVWNPRSGSLIWRVPPKKDKSGFPEYVQALSWSMDGRELRVGTPLRLYSMRRGTGEIVSSFPVSGPSKEWMRTIAFASSTKLVAISYDNGDVAIWMGFGTAPAWRLSTGTFGADLMLASPDGRYFAGESADGAGIWDLQTAERVGTLKPMNWGFGQFAWSPDGRTLASVSSVEIPGTLELVEPRGRYRSIKLPDSNYFAYRGVSWSPDGNQILTGDTVVTFATGQVRPAPAGRGILLWTPTSELKRFTIPNRTGLRQHVLEAPNSKYVAVWNGNTLFVWDMESGAVLFEVPAKPTRGLGQTAWSPDSSEFAYMSAPGVIEVRDIPSASVKRRFTAPIPEWHLATFAWGEKFMLVESVGGAVRLWREP